MISLCGTSMHLPRQTGKDSPIAISNAMDQVFRGTCEIRAPVGLTQTRLYSLTDLAHACAKSRLAEDWRGPLSPPRAMQTRPFVAGFSFAIPWPGGSAYVFITA